MADNNSKKSSSFSSSSDFSKSGSVADNSAPKASVNTTAGLNQSIGISETNTASRTNSVGSNAGTSLSVERSRDLANVAVAEGGGGIGGNLDSSGGGSGRGYATQSSVNSKAGYTERGSLSDSVGTSRSISQREGSNSSVSGGTDFSNSSSMGASASISVSAGSRVSSTEQITSGVSSEISGSGYSGFSNPDDNKPGMTKSLINDVSSVLGSSNEFNKAMDQIQTSLYQGNGALSKASELSSSLSAETTSSKSLSSSSVTTSSISEVSFDPETGTKFERTYSESSDGTISLRLVKEDQISESIDGVLKSQIESSVSVISVSADLIEKSTYIDRISETTDSFGNKSSNQSIETISSEVVRNPSVSEIGAAFNQIEGIRRELAGDRSQLNEYGASSYAESSSRSISGAEEGIGKTYATEQSVSIDNGVGSTASKSAGIDNTIGALKGLDLDR